MKQGGCATVGIEWDNHKSPFLAVGWVHLRHLVPKGRQASELNCKHPYYIWSLFARHKEVLSFKG